MNKRKAGELSQSTIQKPLRKVRSLSGYNIWHGQYLKEHASSQKSLAATNSESASQWRLLSAENKQKYNKEARERSSNPEVFKPKKEVTKILSHLQELGDRADSIGGCHFAYVLVHDSNHYVGGTDTGVQFLKDCGSYVPYSFLGYLSAKESGFLPSSSSSKGAEKDVLRKSVEALFNKLYGDYVNDQSVRLPYSKVDEYGISIEGLPATCTLKHPSSYGKAMLKDILARKENLKLYASRLSSAKVKRVVRKEVVKSPPLPSSFLTKLPPDEGSIRFVETQTEQPTDPPISIKDKEEHSTFVKPVSTKPLQHDHTYFKQSGKRAANVTQKLKVNSKVVLKKDGSSSPVGIGTIVDGQTLHGKPIPNGFVKVMIDSIQPHISPMLRSVFDEDELKAQQFTAWPLDLIVLKT